MSVADELDALQVLYSPARLSALEAKLPEIQALHKRVVVQLMPLLLQVQQEQLALHLQLQQGQQQQGADAAPTTIKLEPGQSQQQQQGGLPQLPAGLSPHDTPAMRALNSLMLEYSRELHTFAVLNRVSTQQLYALNIETGVLGVPPPAGHWKRVAVMLKDRCVMRLVKRHVKRHVERHLWCADVLMSQVLGALAGHWKRVAAMLKDRCAE
jgi:hypothetical protein